MSYILHKDIESIINRLDFKEDPDHKDLYYLTEQEIKYIKAGLQETYKVWVME